MPCMRYLRLKFTWVLMPHCDKLVYISRRASGPPPLFFLDPVPTVRSQWQRAPIDNLTQFLDSTDSNEWVVTCWTPFGRFFALVKSPVLQVDAFSFQQPRLKIAGKNWFIFVPPKGTGSLFLFHTGDMSYPSLENIIMICRFCTYIQYNEDTSCFCSKHSRCIDIFQSETGKMSWTKFEVTTTKQATRCPSLIEPVLEAAFPTSRKEGCAGVVLRVRKAEPCQQDHHGNVLTPHNTLHTATTMRCWSTCKGFEGSGRLGHRTVWVLRAGIT